MEYSLKTNLSDKIVFATKWSAITEILAKLITPITSMVMARLLTPEAFGIVATFSIIISLADIFADAGFQRYLIQHEFKDNLERDRTTNVAFWSNLFLSFFLWALIIVFRNPLAELVGSPGLGTVLVIICAGIPLTGFCSIQMALFKRDFDFKTLFWRRLVAILIPVFVTIPLALWLRSYWALVIGTLAGQIANAALLSIKSNWKPRWFYRFSILRDMFSFCSWSLIDAILIWATSYVDIFFIGKFLNVFDLGLYRTSISTVGAILSLISGIVLPILLPSLSRLQNDISQMRQMLLRFQKTMAIVLLPMGVGVFVFRNTITDIMLGSQWTAAAGFLGLWGLMEAITVIFARFCSNVYPAIGKPHVSVLVQIAHLVVLVPAIFISGQYGFKALYITRSFIRLEAVMVNFIALYILIKLSPWKMMVNIAPQVFCSCIMAVLGVCLLHINNGIIISLVWIIICGGIYFASLYSLFPKERKVMDSIFQKVTTTLKRNKTKRVDDMKSQI